MDSSNSLSRNGNLKPISKFDSYTAPKEQTEMFTFSMNSLK